MQNSLKRESVQSEEPLAMPNPRTGHREMALEQSSAAPHPPFPVHPNPPDSLWVSFLQQSSPLVIVHAQHGLQLL